MYTCVSCSEETIPARVIELHPARFALVATGSGLEEVSLALVDARVGDLVLVHGGEAVALVPPGEAQSPRRKSPMNQPSA